MFDYPIFWLLSQIITFQVSFSLSSVLFIGHYKSSICSSETCLTTQYKLRYFFLGKLVHTCRSRLQMMPNIILDRWLTLGGCRLDLKLNFICASRIPKDSSDSFAVDWGNWFKSKLGCIQDTRGITLMPPEMKALVLRTSSPHLVGHLGR